MDLKDIFDGPDPDQKRRDERLEQDRIKKQELLKEEILRGIQATELKYARQQTFDFATPSEDDWGGYKVLPPKEEV